MKAMFVVAEQVGDGRSAKSAVRPWFAADVVGFAGSNNLDHFIGNVFSRDQSVLDGIAADVRTVLSAPIDVYGTNLEYDDAFVIPPLTRGKIIMWVKEQWGQEFSELVAENAQSRQYITTEIMRKVSGVPDADPLNGWRIGWK